PKFCSYSWTARSCELLTGKSRRTSHWKVLFPVQGNAVVGRRIPSAASMAMSESVLTTKQQVESIWDLGGLTWKQLAKQVWDSARNSDLLGWASQLAYNFLLAVFPLL